MTKSPQIPLQAIDFSPNNGGGLSRLALNHRKGASLYKLRRSLRRSASSTKRAIETAIDLGAPWREK